MVRLRNFSLCLGSSRSTAFYDSCPLPACIQMAKVTGLFSGGLVVDGSGFLASAHRRVVDEFIEVVLDDLAGDMGDVERNVLGVALRSEVETRLAPEILAIHSLLLGADAETLAKLPEWLDLVQTPLTGERDFLEGVGRRFDPAGSALLEENLGLLPGQSASARAFASTLWSMAPNVRRPG